MQALETHQQAELASLRGEKERLRRLLGRQSGALAGLERSLRAASSNSSLLQRQQRQLLESVQRLVRVVAQGPGEQPAAARRGRGRGAGRTGGGASGLPSRLPRGLEATAGKARPLVTTKKNNGEDKSPRKDQSRLYPLTPRGTLGTDLPLSWPQFPPSICESDDNDKDSSSPD